MLAIFFDEFENDEILKLILHIIIKNVEKTEKNHCILKIDIQTKKTKNLKVDAYYEKPERYRKY